MRGKNLYSIREHLRPSYDARLTLPAGNQSHQTSFGNASSNLISMDGIFWFKPVYGVPKRPDSPVGTIQSLPFVPEE